MELKVIGTGSKGNAYLLENEEEALLIECGVNIKEIKKALNFDLSKLDGCVITHEHGDHAKSVKELMKAGVRVFATVKTHEAMGTTLQHRAHMVKRQSETKIGSFSIFPFSVVHDAADPVGFVIGHPETGHTLFLTDTIYCEYQFRGLNNIIIEANYSKEIIDRKLKSDKKFLRDRVIENHMSLSTCIKTLLMNDLSKVNNIMLIHLSDSNSHEENFKAKVSEATGKNVTVASNGTQLEFNEKPF